MTTIADALTPEPALRAHYETACATVSAIQPHLPRLRQLATGCALVQEFGVKRAFSTTALLMGAARVLSYDILATREAKALQAAVDRWEYRIADSRYAPVTECDLLFIDSLHTYGQVRAELDRHADAVNRYLVFHDTITFGSIGAQGESGQHCWIYTPGHAAPKEALGIRPAIDELMMRDASWFLRAHYTDSHGLLVLERR